MHTGVNSNSERTTKCRLTHTSNNNQHLYCHSYNHYNNCNGDNMRQPQEYKPQPPPKATSQTATAETVAATTTALTAPALATATATTAARRTQGTILIRSNFDQGRFIGSFHRILCKLMAGQQQDSHFSNDEHSYTSGIAKTPDPSNKLLLIQLNCLSQHILSTCLTRQKLWILTDALWLAIAGTSWPLGWLTA